MIREIKKNISESCLFRQIRFPDEIVSKVFFFKLNLANFNPLPLYHHSLDILLNLSQSIFALLLVYF